jgi:hypothetical protein
MTKMTRSQGREIGVLIALVVNAMVRRRAANASRRATKAIALDPKYQELADNINRIYG